ncbi:MAG: TonB-dependent receptor [Pseudomonadota bacterium]
MTYKKYWLQLGVASAVLAAGLPVHAQDSGGSLFTEEIFVTAQKREENIQDVGISITALSGKQIQALGYTNAQQVTALAPGVSTIQPNGEANYSIAIRGVANSDFTTNVESPIAIYVDDVYISQTSGAGFLLFDMERVEILRGPQGTLFGRNATGGLVSYTTVKPTDEFEGFGNITYGRFERVRLQGAVNMPIAEGLSMRVSAMTHQGGGYVENRLDPGNDLNNANETAGRVQLLWEPTETFDLLLNARFGDQDIRTGFFEFASAAFPDGNLTPGVPIPELGDYVDNDGDIFAGDYDRTGFNKLDTWGTSATMNWDVGFGTITSITDYQSVKRNYIEDSDASPADYFSFFLTTDSQQFTQELRIAGENGPLKWVGGFYYLDLDIDDSNGAITPELFAALFGSAEDTGFNGLRNPYTIDRQSWSLFGQLDYALTDKITLTGGFRYIDEDTDFTYSNLLALYADDINSGLDPRIVDVGDALDPLDRSRSDSEWAARLQLNYKASEDLLLYASWNRGVKSGGFNAPLLPTAELLADGSTATLPDGEVIDVSFVTYEPERLDAFELGFKWDAAPGVFRLNGSAYYYDYKDAQVFSIIGLDTFTVNADSEVYGFELEAIATPIDGLDIQFGLGFIEADIENVPGLTLDVDVPALETTLPAVLPGATVSPVQTPKWNINGLVRYQFPVGPGDIALQADMQYRSEHFFALTGFEAVTENGYFLANASVTYIPEGADWDLRFFVENLTDEEYLVQTFDLSGSLSNGGLFGLVEQYYGRPRMWGVQASYNF